MAAVVIGTAGHIDHGKSTLVEALTGTHPDRLKEERARGITIDLGFAHVEHDGVILSFVDVPGHERFVRNMLAGAAGIDAVLLVVAADAGVQPQTREHFEICRLLGVDRGVIALTKCDLADAETRAVSAAEARDLVRGSVLEQAPLVEVAARTGAGLPALAAALAALARQAREAVGAVVRLPIDRVFTLKGFGTVVTGTLGSGSVAPGDSLTVLPADQRVRVRGVHVHGGAVPRATATSRAAVNLAGIDTTEIARGHVLATPGALHVARRADVLLELLPGRPLRHGSRLRVHQGTGEASALVSIAAWRSGPREAWTAAPAGVAGIVAPGGGEALARLRLRDPLVLRRGDRLIVRASLPAGTVAGGVVIDPDPPAAGVRRRATLDRLARLLADPIALDVWMEAAGAAGVDAATLIRRAGVDPDVVATVMDDAVRAGSAVRAGDRVFTIAAAQSVERGMLAAIEAHHRGHPADPGAPRESVRTQAGAGADARLVDDTLARLHASGVIRGEERLALASHRPAAPDRDQHAAVVFESVLAAAALTPPDVPALALAAGVTVEAAGRVLAGMGRARRLVRLETIWFHPEALAALRRDVQALRAPGGSPPATIDVGTFKVKFGVSRKFAIPLLEWLDRERVTRRIGDRRVVL